MSKMKHGYAFIKGSASGLDFIDADELRAFLFAFIPVHWD